MATQTNTPAAETPATETKPTAAPVAAEAQPKTLPDAVAKKYKLEGIDVGVHILSVKFGREKVDFSAITIEKADELAGKGFSYLKKIKE